MPDPNVSDRERLLRLIDGGPEVVKEVQQQREAPAEKKPVAVTPAAAGPKPPAPDTFSSVKAWWIKSGLDAAALIKLAAALLLLAVAIYSFTGVVQKMGHNEKTDSASVPSSADGRTPDETGAGLRLVGVDWGDAPVALLEDLKTGKTYFAKTNEKIKDVRIKQIFKDKVLASVRGKNVELR